MAQFLKTLLAFGIMIAYIISVISIVFGIIEIFLIKVKGKTKEKLTKIKNFTFYSATTYMVCYLAMIAIVWIGLV